MPWSCCRARCGTGATLAAGDRGTRRSLTPVLVTGAMTLGFLALAILGISPGVSDTFLLAALTCFAFVPFGFLLGLLRSRFGEAEAVTLVLRRLSARTGRPALRDALAEALGDTRLQLAYWVREVSSTPTPTAAGSTFRCRALTRRRR